MIVSHGKIFCLSSFIGVFHLLLVEDWNVESQHERPRLKLQISTLPFDWELLSFPAINFGVWACGLDDF